MIRRWRRTCEVPPLPTTSSFWYGVPFTGTYLSRKVPAVISQPRRDYE